MESSILKSNISRLKTNDLFLVLQRWNFLKSDEIKSLKSNSNAKTKRASSIQIIDICNERGGLSMEKVGEFELICVQMDSTKRQWSAYQLSEKQEGSKQDDQLCPVRFKKKLTRLIKLYFSKDCCTSILLHNGLLWGRVYLPRQGVRTYQPRRCLYFVHYPQTPVIVISGMMAAYNEFISQCLVIALHYKSLVELTLTGRHMESIAELAINKLCQGGFTRFQQTQRLSGPLDSVTSRKRKALEDINLENVHDEHRGEKRQRRDMLDVGFGEFVQPTLEKVEYRVELPYRSKDIVPELNNDGELFHSRVKFNGSSVLEGLRNLGTTGYATVPLPKHLLCVPSRARNYFLLAKPNRQNNTELQNKLQNQSKTANQSVNQSKNANQSVSNSKFVNQSMASKQLDNSKRKSGGGTKQSELKRKQTTTKR